MTLTTARSRRCPPPPRDKMIRCPRCPVPSEAQCVSRRSARVSRSSPACAHLSHTAAGVVDLKQLGSSWGAAKRDERGRMGRGWSSPGHCGLGMSSSMPAGGAWDQGAGRCRRPDNWAGRGCQRGSPLGFQAWLERNISTGAGQEAHMPGPGRRSVSVRSCPRASCPGGMEIRGPSAE